MLAQELSQKVRFGPYEADFAEGVLRKSGIRLHIQGKPLAVLQVLVENQGEIVSRETLRARLWEQANVFVDFDKNLSTAVNKLREALCDSAERPRYIETVPRHGYRFLAPVESLAPRSPRPQFDRAPEKRPLFPVWAKLRLRAVLLIVLVGLCGIASAWFFRKKGGSTHQPTPPTIAVLPFANRSPDPSEDYFSEGLSDEVITQLGRVPGLKMIGRYSSSQFRLGSADSREIGRRLGVDFLVEGTVVKIKDRVLIQAELVKANDGFQLWTESYETRVDDVLRVEDDISRSVSSALTAKLFSTTGEGAPASAPSVNAEAYQAYLQARYFKGRWIVNELKTSLVFLNQSLRIAPDYAPAWALRSSVYSSMGDMGAMKKTEALQKAREDAERSIALDPNLAEGYVALSTVQMNDWDWRQAEATLEKASALAPREPNVLMARSQLYRMLGQVKDCIDVLKKVTVIDPLSPGAFGMLGNRLFYVGRYQEALSAQQRALELNPDAEFVHLNRAEVYLKLRRFEEAKDEVGREPGELWNLLGKAMVYQELGQMQASDAALKELIAKHKEDEAFLISEIYAYRNDPENAFTWLERAYQQRDSSLIDIKNDPFLEKLRNDPRYLRLLSKMGLPF
jgi:TolB-like protein/DNA-binding winged helix-turn-helix (wHTH) protein/Tfp pilus assembly protein PilF